MSRREFDHALIVGKFFPPHVGHEYLVRTALQFSRRVTVLVLAASSEPLPMERRAQWLRECFPDADDLRVVAALDDIPVDYDDEAIWRAHVDVMRRALAGDAAAHDELERPIDVVFSSEEYGETLARWPVPVHPGDTPSQLAARVLAVEHVIFPRIVDALAAVAVRERIDATATRATATP